ncbi:MAG: Fic family protein [Candidatus Levybacteria bacterium]|nr:Fic family protein [Candidatus Levybacteria bacterium]
MEIGKIIKQPKGYSAFIPSSFPPDIQSLRVDQTISELEFWAGHNLAKLDGVTQRLPDLDFFIYMYVRKEAAFSSQIEGTKADLIDSIKAEAAIEDDLPDDVDTIQAYIDAMNYGLNRMKEFPLTLRFLRETHAILLAHERFKSKTPGEFRTSQNWISGTSPSDALYVPPPPNEMNQALHDLEKFLYSDYYSPLMKIALAHAQFETIHPFQDGNGRTGRLLVTFYLYKENVLERPVLYLSKFFGGNDKRREKYFDLLHSYHTKGDVRAWLIFFFTGISEIAKDAIDTSNKIMDLREKDMDKIHSLGRGAPTGVKILQNLFKLPIVDAKKIAEWSGNSIQASYTTIERFMELGILEQRNVEKTYGKTYVYKDYLKLFTAL